MAIDPDSLKEVFQLTQLCEDVARAALGIAQDQLRTKLITQEVFDQAFQDYGLAMQKARDMYYQASHSLAQQIAAMEGVEGNRSLMLTWLGLSGRRSLRVAPWPLPGVARKPSRLKVLST